MTLSSSTLDFSSLNAELGNQSTATISFNDVSVRNLANVGGTGVQTNLNTSIQASSLLGHSYMPINISSDQTNYVVTTTAPGKTYGVVSIGSGVVVGATSSSNYALNIQGSSGDLVVLQNAGYIVGKGGDGGLGTYSNPGPSQGGQGQGGGPAMLVQGALTALYNVGTIGGGGGGGNGGLGYEDRQRPRRGHGGAGGGGGAGFYVGGGGQDAGGGQGQAGSLTAGGLPGGTNGQAFNGGGQGGSGGGLGQAGGAGSQGSPTTPADGGAAIVGANYIQFAQSGSIYGAQNNI